MIVIVRFRDDGILQFSGKTYVKFENAVKSLVLFGKEPLVRVITDQETPSRQIWEATQTLNGKPLVWYLIDIENDIRDIITGSIRLNRKEA